jgi:recombination protein RecA
VNFSAINVVPASHLGAERGNREGRQEGENGNPARSAPSGQLAQGWNARRISGGLAELFGSQGGLTLAAELVRQAHERRESVAWIFAHPDTFYPPDAADNGIDLAALPVIFAQNGKKAFRSAEILLRSGAFGLIVIDLGEKNNVPPAYQGRVVRLAQHYRSAVLCLTAQRVSGCSGSAGAIPSATAATLGSMVSLRLEPRRTEISTQHISYELRATKDKRHGPGWTHRAVYRSLAGLR